MQRVTKEEYSEWRESYITQELFNFFKLEAELHRRRLASGDLEGSFEDVGQKYKEIQWAAKCYDMLDTIEYEDIFPLEEYKNESSQES